MATIYESSEILELKRAKPGERISVNVSLAHPLYTENVSTWRKCRDAFEGEEAIKAGGTKYLPQLSGQTSGEYKNFLNRAQWFDATNETVKTYREMIFRKAPQIFYGNNIDAANLPKDNFYDVISTDGKSFDEFSTEVTQELLITNRAGILVDFPDMNKNGNILEYISDYESRDVKPLLSLYKAESIRNWFWTYIDYKLVPLYFVLEEIFYDSFSGSLVAQPYSIYRVLFLEDYITENGEVGYRYKQIVCKDITVTGQQIQYDVQDVIYPIKDGKYLDHIPFFILDDKGINYKTIEKPLINGLVNVNIGHFKNSADWENEIHMVGHKTIYFPGWEKKIWGNPRIGGALAGPANCRPEIIQASSDSSIKEEMISKVEQMAVLGAQKISSKQAYVSSANAAKVSPSSDSSSITVLAKSLGKSFTKILKFLLDWSIYKNTEVSIKFNTDFFDDGITGEELLQWIKALQNGGISDKTFHYNMKRRELYPDSWTSEDEREAIKESQQDLLNFNNEMYVELVQRVDQLEGNYNATVTSSSSGQTLTSISTAGGGSNVSTSTNLSEKSAETAVARNNETPGSSSASAKEKSPVSAEENTKKAEDRETHNPNQ
jgi:hypothetical protein